jgi:hypothetical protein
VTRRLRRQVLRLPEAERAVVDPRKVRDYLLSTAHPVGRFKAVFFQALGYTAEDWARLAEDLLRHALDNEARLAETNRYGQKYEVHGELIGPTGRSARLVAVWIVLDTEDHPRFVTAFPGARP